MSTEKLSDASKTELEHNPFTQICNAVIEHIKDNDAFRLYAYLAAKSRGWNVVKEWTSKVCGVGERKSKQCWSYLERCGLIEYIAIRNDKGKFLKHDIRVLNGTKFNPDEPFLKSSGAETAPLDSYPQAENDTDINQQLNTNVHRCNNPPCGESTRVDFAPLLNKDITNKDSKRKKDKSFCASAQKKSKSDWREENAKQHDFAESMNNVAQSKTQMDNEAKHIEQHEQIKYAPMPESLRN